MSSFDDICYSIERIGHCRAHLDGRLSADDEREWRWELRAAQGRLLSAIERRSDTLAGYFSLPVGVIVIAGLCYANPQLLREDANFTWEILAGIAAGTVVHLWARRRYRAKLELRLSHHLASA